MADEAACLNCGATLRGQYCGQCGQRARSRLISLYELLRDAFGDLFELDSRLWQTLLPLLARPGHLTADYLQGRRARYMPPFRMYLVLSLLFFVVAFYDPAEQFALLYDDPPVEAATTTDTGSEDSASTLDIRVGDADATATCKVDADDVAGLRAVFGERITQEKLQSVCDRMFADGGKSFAGRILDNVPAGLILLLPVMALVLKVLYPLSRRYYVEHLLFFVHFHSFFFLVLTLQIVYSRIGSLVGAPGPVVVLPVVASSLYIPVYLFIAMRRVYGQGRLLTLLKYLVLLAAYVAGMALVMAGAVLLAILST